MAKLLNRKYFLSFVEEGVMNPKYAGYVGGRIEIHAKNEQYAIDEIRFFTNKLDKFFKFRDENDLRDVNLDELAIVTEIVSNEFKDKI